VAAGLRGPAAISLARSISEAGRGAQEWSPRLGQGLWVTNPRSKVSVSSVRQSRPPQRTAQAHLAALPDRGASTQIYSGLRGTEGSNPPSSSSESLANPDFMLRVQLSNSVSAALVTSRAKFGPAVTATPLPRILPAKFPSLGTNL
jgi:hypothetical protein